jgi:hypothetical protein
LLEVEEYRQTFCGGELPDLAAHSPFGGRTK